MNGIFRTIIAASCGFGLAHVATAATPPEQPLTGPGGREIAHAQVIVHSYGSGSRAYWLFEPSQPMPNEAPLIVFNHGWAAMDPGLYMAWIDHLVERGNIVVYPVYQDNLLTAAKDFTADAIVAVKDAIRRLQSEPGHVQPRLDRFAIVGHSMGGDVSANMAALWHTEGLPFPRAVMCVEPGKSWGQPAWLDIELADLSKVPARTLLLTVAGDDDHIVRDIDAKRIFIESTQVPAANKDYITLVSDDHGRPALHADHMAPLAWAQMPGMDHRAASDSPGHKGGERPPANHDMPDFTDTAESVNALDYYGTWKLFDGLTDAAFFGTNRKYALGDTPEQRFMGVWSDGVPVKQLKVTDRP
ncbi:MAG TPA: alpha/beta hydrolase [Xanthomonadaceae bacterium]|nr:alpha/beta hydrolase [Xanthomonadaceae bacterium]